MKRFTFSAMARQDLLDIARFIARENPVRARSFTAELREHYRSLTDDPERGAPRDRIRQHFRLLPYRAYNIYYDVLDDRVRIARILHSARDIGDMDFSES